MWETISQTPGATFFFWVALASTVLFTLKLSLSLLGGGHGDMDAGLDAGGEATHMDGSSGDAHGDTPGHHGSGAAFALLSVQSVLAFLMGMGWSGLAARVEWQWPTLPTLLVSGLFGFSMMVMTSYLTFQLRRLNREIPVDFESCVGSVGRVYLTVPAQGRGQGQVEVKVSGRLRILPASSTGDEIPAFASVTVMRVESDGTLLVAPCS
ncbi:MAG: hypothetical protein KA354_20080 [Phycisphaerae bacterium]|nr:hypothetical protein [Phycisphaerae bacterium]